jgi:hypothetical protein
MDELKDKLNKLREEAIANPGKKKKGCSSCKKKKPVEELPQLDVEAETLYVPTEADIKLAYAELTSMKGVKPESKELISKVYEFFFNDKFNFDCGGCASRQANVFHHYITNVLKLSI